MLKEGRITNNLTREELEADTTKYIFSIYSNIGTPYGYEYNKNTGRHMIELHGKLYDILENPDIFIEAFNIYLEKIGNTLFKLSDFYTNGTGYPQTGVFITVKTMTCEEFFEELKNDPDDDWDVDEEIEWESISIIKICS